MSFEDDSEAVGDNGIAKALSAYHHYSRMSSALVKDELTREGKDSSLGTVVSLVSTKWKTLSEDEKAPYVKMAKDDKARYDAECFQRDEEALKEQEERRAQHSYDGKDMSRMRGSTMNLTEKSTDKANVVKKTRVVSEEDKAKNAERKAEKKEEDDRIKSQMAELKQNKAEQAESRLKYLLGQSDIFSHFGAAKGFKPPPPENQPKIPKKRGRRPKNYDPSKDPANQPSTSSSNYQSSSSDKLDEMDEDEMAMAQEQEEIEDGKDSGKYHTLLTQPSIITGGAMRSYQLEGLNWMIRLRANGINGILADEMGLGKTLQSISVVAYMREFQNTTGPHLVMVPKSTLSNWCNEFKRWCPIVKVCRFHGSKDDREAMIKDVLKPGVLHEERDWDVIITTYEIVNLERAALCKIAWNYLIIDEAHRLKNEASQFSTTVRLLQTNHRLLLTGTPLQNNLHELWALLNFLLPDVFESSEQFDDWFNLDVDDTEAKQRIIGQLHKLLRPFMLRRLKADVEKSLPPKTETILFTGMSAMQKQLYKQVLLRDIDMINGASSSSSNGARTAILNIVMQLRKCCNHPYLFPGVEDRSLDPMGEHLVENCGKMVLLDKLLKKMKERDHRVLIFSQMTRMIDILEDYCISMSYKYCRIDGNTTYEEREDRIAEFNRENSDTFIFVLSTRAGGLGINLQTADTVILYDSDWNPQADLQAQDRAHRIGQKKPVTVFRLVTDETVEVKVVERAQQKLKLDAMVVQQGRLQDKEKKMSKQDLLDTLRFGADKVFRSKESSISDNDIDAILEEGKKRTDEISKLTANEKGDMYDFRLDGGMSTQVFEGKDYSDRQMRESELQALAGVQFLDPGKRERKAIQAYSETAPRQENEGTTKVQKLPRHLRLNRMDDHQFFNRERLYELQNEEIRLFDLLVENGEAPGSGGITKFIVLPVEEHEEKTRLIAEGFGEWNRVHFNNFIRASAKYGRHAHEKIAKDVGHSEEETERYVTAFWEKGPTELPQAEWDRALKTIEKGEKRVEEIQRLTNATAKLISMFDDPWEELTFRNINQGGGRIFNAVEDRFLLCLTHLHGYGNWTQVRNSVRRCERFRFDFYLQSCSAEALGKRCEMLMRSAERELTEIERKKQVASAQVATVSKSRNVIDVAKERLHEITKQIAEESKRLAATRMQLAKHRAGNAAGTANTAGASMPEGEKVVEEKGVESSSSMAAGRAPGYAVPVPLGLVPELCRLLVAAGPEGVSKVINPFVAKHPQYAKRQVEFKMHEIGVKERRPGVSDKIIWHIRDEYKSYLAMENFHDEKDDPPMPPAGASSSSSKPSKEKEGKGGADAKKRKRASEGKGGASAEDNEGESKHALDPELLASLKAVAEKEPKKFKRAFGFFVKHKRADAERDLGANSSNADALRDKLTKMWEEADEETVGIYQEMEQDDRKRYTKEYVAWEQAREAIEKHNNAGSSNGAGSGSSTKKKKVKESKE